MDDTRSICSWESFYSVESATSEEEEGEEEQLLSPKGNFRIFLLGDGKEVRLPRYRRCLNGSGFLLLPGLSGQGLKQPLGLQTPGSGCLRGPEGPGETLRSRRASPNGSLPGQRVNRKRAEGSGGCKLQSSATGGSRPTLCPTASVPSPGIKRQRRKETEETLHSPCWTEGDQAFAQKCWELQGFVRPLMELLNRLKMGCFDQGLSSFQQSVAMDRIQRIIGVLQKPQIGERYLGTLLQVEKMLKIWYPHIPLKDSQASYSVSAREACGAAKSLCVEDQIVESRSPSTQGYMPRPFSDLSSLEDHDVGTRQGEPVPRGNEPALDSHVALEPSLGTSRLQSDELRAWADVAGAKHKQLRSGFLSPKGYVCRGCFQDSCTGLPSWHAVLWLRAATSLSKLAWCPDSKQLRPQRNSWWPLFVAAPLVWGEAGEE